MVALHYNYYANEIKVVLFIYLTLRHSEPSSLQTFDSCVVVFAGCLNADEDIV